MQRPVNSNAQPPGPAVVGALLRDNDLPRLEASMLLAQVLGCGRASVLADPARRLSHEEALRFAQLRARRLRGEPIAYLTGFREFYGLTFAITNDVLIPRPETEALVDAALLHLPVRASLRVLDLGTGSGAAAIAIAKHRPLATVHAVDVSPAASALARENARAHGAANVIVAVSDWYSACVGRYDIIVSNPPYISAEDPHLGRGDLRFEPPLALTPGPEGTEAMREIIARACDYLNPGGWLMLEHGFDQAAACRKMMADHGFTGITSRRDLAAIERVTSGRAPT